MKPILRLAAALVLATAPAFAQDPVEGLWQTARDDNGNFGHVEITPCPTGFCGVLVRAFDSGGAEVQSPNVGRRIVWDMRAQGDGSYGRGRIWAPDRDKTYASKMALRGDRLSVSGCILGGAICRDGGTWQRVR